MKKNLILFMTPLALLSLALTSCGGKTSKKYELKRISYANHSQWANLSEWGVLSQKAGFGRVIDAASKEQYIERKYYCLIDKGLEKATVTTNADISINGRGTIIINGERPIDINNIAGQIADTTKTSWDIDKGYLKSEDSLGGTNYIIKDNVDHQYWRCFTTGIKDDEGKETKYKIKVTDYIEQAGDFQNVVLIEAASNSGIKNYLTYDPDTGKGEASYSGLDISGFSDSFLGNPELESNANNELGFEYSNTFNMGTRLTAPIFEDLPEVKITLLDLLDIATQAIDDAELDVNLLDFSYNGNKDGKDAEKASMDFGLHNENLKIVKDIYDEVDALLSLEEVHLPFSITKSSGKGTVDYFLAYENRFIRQQEILIKLKKTDFTLTPNPDSDNPTPLIVDLKGVNAEAVINEDVKAGSCDFDQINLDEFKEITIPGSELL